MYKNVICVGTIWDLDDVAYPELDDYSAMSRWNYYQVMKYQLSSSRKEMKNVVKLPLFPRNQYGIRVRACCASLKRLVKAGNASARTTTSRWSRWRSASVG